MEYSEHILPVVEGKCLPQCKWVLEDGKWKKVWWYPEPEDLEPEEAQRNHRGIQMREANLERRFVKGVKDAGAVAWKLICPGHSGVPDRIVLIPGGKIVFIELKTESGSLTPLQIETHNELRDLGFDVRTLYGKPYVEGFIHELRSMGLSGTRRTMDPVAPQVRAIPLDGIGQDGDYTDGCK